MSGTGYYGPDATDALLFAISECLEDWGDDPAYAKPAQKLREVQRELDVLRQSPGARAAERASEANQTGQTPSNESD